MARVAFDAHRTTVDILMARHACRAQAQGRFPPLLGDLGILDELRGMAIVAFLLRVLSRQQEPRFRMVEMGQIHEGNPCILPKVVLVTGDATLRRHHVMKPVTGIDLLLDFGMTRQALHSADFLPHFMTIRTVIDPFKLLMRPSQLSRRKLCKSTMHSTTQCKTQDKMIRPHVCSGILVTSPARHPLSTASHTHWLSSLARLGDEQK